jgi:sulfatase modifying factor 1
VSSWWLVWLTLTGCGWLWGAAEVSTPPEAQRCETRRSFECFAEVPSGSFLYGAQASDPQAPGFDPAAQPDEGPPIERLVSGFWMHRYEVSASQVARCLGAGACREDDVAHGGMSNVGREGVGHHPANSVSWRGASDTCRWLGARLPTELEWEYAARGSEGRRFPWGSNPRCVGVAGIVAAGFQGGADTRETHCERKSTSGGGELRLESPFGLLGMGGNVWEWVEDTYREDRREHALDEGMTALRVQRGGGWMSVDPLEFRGAGRGRMAPDAKLQDVGFRCVWVGQ